MSAKAPAQPTRPSTAPNTRVRLRNYQQLVQQLTNTVEETKRPPPAGADAEAIAARRIKLERVLRDVKESIAGTKREQRDHQTARFKKAVEDQVKKEEDLLRHSDEQSVRSKAAQNDYWHNTMNRRNYLNTTMERRTNEAHQFLESEDQRRRRENAELTEHRRVKLERQEAQQREARAASARRHAEIHAHAQDLQDRKAEADRQRQAAADAKSKQHAIDCQKKNRLLAEKRRKEANERAQSQRNAAVKGHVNRVKVILRPTPTLVIDEKDHETRVRELQEEDEAQRQRYAKEEAIRNHERMRKRHILNTKIQMRDSTYINLCDKHHEENEDLKQQLEDQSHMVAEFRRHRADYYSSYGNNKAQSIMEHQKKAAERRNAKIDDTFQRNYLRWNRRADHVMDKIIGNYRALNTPAGGGGNNNNNSTATSKGGKSPSASPLNAGGSGAGGPSHSSPSSHHHHGRLAVKLPPEGEHQ